MTVPCVVIVMIHMSEALSEWVVTHADTYSYIQY